MVPEIFKKSISDQCEFDAREKDAQIRKYAPKGSQNGSRNRENIDKNGGSKKVWIFSPPARAQDARPGINGGDFGGSLLVRFNIPTVKYGQ